MIILEEEKELIGMKEAKKTNKITDKDGQL
jgi:hypothetical protein